MARNVEIKACIASVEALIPTAATLASDGPFEIEQDDTFFRCESGRLKLRDFLNGTGELIFYRRTNQLGPKECCPHCKVGHWLVVEQLLADRAAVAAIIPAACRGPP